jgi:Alw26I/Eco31I/Esp3I family type II restriction m6 adenine DNA methyltransferase
MVEASKLRLTYIAQELDSFVDNFVAEEHFEIEIKNTLFEEYVKSADIGKDDLRQFAFSSYITKKILYNHNHDVSNLEELFFFSKIVEYGYYKLNTDLSSIKTKNVLTISKEYGVFYTPIAIAREMAEKVVKNSLSKIIIDPCCGTGNLLGACLEYAAKNNIQLQKVIGIEIDTLSSEVCERSLRSLAKNLGLSVEIEILNRDALDVFAEQDEICGEKLPIGSIIINPPYGKLKFDSDNLSNLETKLDYREFHLAKKYQKHIDSQSKVKKILNGLSSGKGTLEWSKIFLSLCIRYLSNEETLVFIGPCSWLNNQSFSDVRERIHRNRLLREIHFISENRTGFETVNQSLSIVSFKFNSDNIEIQNDNFHKDILSYHELSKLKSYGYAIPRIDTSQIRIFLRLQSHRKIKDVENLSNLRGELDQSLNKKVFTQKRSFLQIIRGENFRRYAMVEPLFAQEYFVDINEFERQIGDKPKGRHFQKRRIVGRQCSYMKQQRRLVFSICPENYLVGNSCNYLQVPDEDIYYYLGLLNSALFDWYFRVMNGNNHVANYEINDFPIPDGNNKFKKQIVDEVVNIIEQTKDTSDLNVRYYNFEKQLDAIVFDSFEFTKGDAKSVLWKSHSEDYVESVLNLMNNP